LRLSETGEVRLEATTSAFISGLLLLILVVIVQIEQAVEVVGLSVSGWCGQELGEVIRRFWCGLEFLKCFSLGKVDQISHFYFRLSGLRWCAYCLA